jgi:hypothetical protein
MRLQVILAAAAFFAASAIAHAADPAGTYTVEGTSPDGGGTYSGELTITKTGDTYKAVWTIGDETYVGTGLGAEDFITISYKSGGKTGVALYSHDKGGWRGVWTYAGGTKVGTETWAAK